MNSALYNEIASTYLFEMERTALFNHARLFLTHYRELSDEQKSVRPEPPYLLSSRDGFSEKLYMGNADRIARWEDLDENDVVINVIRFSGPIMRNGGGCAYGSMELRDMIKRAADVKQCIGQVFIVDSPGGSSYAKFDFQEALDYANSKGQHTVMLVDGMLCSAAFAWGAVCKKRYAVNAHCQIGSIGTYACFLTHKDKDVNAVTQEMFHEVYSTYSQMKNKAFRNSALGDDLLIRQEVDKSTQAFIELVRKHIPKVKDDQLTGDSWEASEVTGTLIDGIRTFDQVINEILATRGIRLRRNANGEMVMQHDSASDAALQDASAVLHEEDDPDRKPDDDPDDDPEVTDPDQPGDPNQPVDPNAPDDDPDNDPDDDPELTKKKNNQPTKTERQMGKKYEKIQSALGLEALESDKDNSLWLDEGSCDKLTERLVKAERAEGALATKLDELKQLNERIASLKTEHQTELDNLKAEHQTELDRLGKEKDDEKDLALADKDAQLKKMQEQLDQLNNDSEDLKKQLEQKDREIAELSGKPAPQVQPSVVQPSQKDQAPALAASYATAEDQRKAAKERMEYLNRHRRM